MAIWRMQSQLMLATYYSQKNLNKNNWGTLGASPKIWKSWSTEIQSKRNL